MKNRLTWNYKYDYAFERCKKLEYDFIIAKDYKRKDNTYGKRFATLSTIDSVIQLINSTEPEKRVYHEVIRSDKNCKFYLDVEWYDFKYKFDEVKQELERHVIEFFKLAFKLDIGGDVRYCTSNSKTKNSYHLILSNYCFESNNIVKKIVNFIIKSIPKDSILHQLKINKSKDIYGLPLDMAVYTKNKQMRIVNCVKIKDPSRTLVKFDKKNNDRDYLITHTNNCTKLDINKLEFLNKDKNITKKDKIVVNNLNNLTATFLRKVLNTYSKTRVNNYENWINIAFALHSINNKCYDMWNEWSKKGSSYNEKTCHQTWENLKYVDDGYTFRSLLYWAKQDNYEEYLNLINSGMYRIVKRSLCSENSVKIAIT